MRKNYLLLLLFFGLITHVQAQFSGAFAPSNWTFSSTTSGGDGSINISGAPASVVLKGSDSNTMTSNAYEDWRIVIPQAGTISFNYSMVQPDIDYSFYVINGTQTLIANTTTSGAKSNISVTAGQTFSFRIVNDDNGGGRGVLTVSSFVFTPTTPLTATTSQTNVSCNGGSNGSATVTPSGGVSPYTYSWSSSKGSAASATGLLATTYTCTITDAASGSITKNVTIGQPSSALSATSSSTGVSCNGGSNGTASVVASGGTPSYTYSWSPSGGTAATATGLAVGTYTCTITDANGCTFSKSATVNQPTAISTASGSQTNVACNGASIGSASVFPSGGTPGYTYSWSPSGGTAATAAGLAVGSYTVTVTDANACTASRNYIITQPSAISTSSGSQTNVACNGLSIGAASVSPSGGTPGYTYSWSPSGGTAASATGLAAGSYTVTVTDANSCTATRNYIITQPSAISTSSGSQINVACNGLSIGAASVSPSGGTPGYTYSWSPSGGTNATATGLAAGSYTVTVTDANSCTATRNYIITQPSAISTSSGSQTNVSCNGGTNGSASVSPSGGTPGYTYSWSPSGGTAASATGLAAGSYTVTVTDANSCTATQNYIITQPSAISTSSGSQTNVSCNGGTNGSASVSPSGGTPGYTYSWSPSGGTAATATGLAAGSYTVTVTDANACTATRNYTITQPSAISTASGSQTNVSCNGGTNGSATITATGGTGALTYSWSPSGGTAAIATGLAAGTYSCTVTDANSCTKTISGISITEPTAISATNSAKTNVACNGGTTGSATITATGGTGTLTYSWSPSGGTSATATGLAAGTYSCVVTDANSCTKTVNNISITEPTAISATNSAKTNVACNGGTTGSATITASGGTGTLTYSWSPSGGTSATATGLVAGTYSCVVTDANSCTKTVNNISITEPTAISATNSAKTNVACNGGTTGSATITATGGTGTLTYSWSPSGGTSATATGLAAGNYSCVVTDANSCTKTVNNIAITQPTAITATASQTNVSCSGGTNGSATVTATGGIGTLTYSWSPSGGTAATATGLAAGTYSCTVTDANTCTKTVNNIAVTQPTVIATTTTQTNVSCNAGSNGSATVIATGGTGTLTYSWSPSGGTAATATGLVAGTYSCVVTDTNTCNKTVNNIVVTQPTAISANVSSQTDVSSDGGTDGSATITASGGTGTLTYAWSPSGGTSATATGLAAGTYTCTITDANSCAKTVNNIAIVANLANDQFDLAELSYYPNPVKDILNVSYGSDLKVVSVINLLGQELMTQRINSDSARIDMTGLPNGAYMIRFNTDKAVKIIKVIKE